MTRTLVFGQIFLRGISEPDLARAARAVLGREEYAPFEAARLPVGYPALAREVARVAVSDPDDADTRAVLFEDWDRTFARALALSRECPGTDVVAVVRPPLEASRLKAYRDGGVVLKVGEDPDEEVLYRPAVSSDEDVGRFLAAWRPGGERGAGVLAALADIRRDCTYREALAGAWPRPLREWVFLSRRSRLYVES